MGSDDEISNFVKVWIIAIASQCYSYYIAARIPTKGMMRFVSLLPILFLLLVLPSSHLHSIHLGVPSTFFLGWLAVFKLLLFSFDSGPLSPPPTKLLHFISIALLPIHIKQVRVPRKPSTYTITKVVPNESILWGIKALVLGVAIRVYSDHRQQLHPYVNTALSCCHLCVGLEIGFALSVAVPRALFGFQLEPHFDEPYLSTSLQNFWGSRWNLVVTNILRPTVYNPVRRVFKRILGPRWATLVGVISTFVISGFMHEMFFYYVTRVRPTCEMMCFFVLQGVCLLIEVEVKKVAAAHKVRFHPLVSGPLTLVFLIITANWLFFPHIIRNGVDTKALAESANIVDFVNANLPYISIGTKFSQ